MICRQHLKQAMCLQHDITGTCAGSAEHLQHFIETSGIFSSFTG
ncbi:unnamed protein product [Schistosoma curassoni]|uniref:Uncharacterized protein n=1 Tax=Schistosoma curassoni TaxID=6186 RepID=A0A183KA56_9TREM|nr:unnamed protein product [Schistosoma curassoni]